MEITNHSSDALSESYTIVDDNDKFYTVTITDKKVTYVEDIMVFKGNDTYVHGTKRVSRNKKKELMEFIQSQN
ncbi:hypothetical protein FVI60_08930 [Campylobacter jejuni]|nr:hypothetical protein [Campylobacter jejuni]